MKSRGSLQASSVDPEAPTTSSPIDSRRLMMETGTSTFGSNAHLAWQSLNYNSQSHCANYEAHDITADLSPCHDGFDGSDFSPTAMEALFLNQFAAPQSPMDSRPNEYHENIQSTWSASTSMASNNRHLANNGALQLMSPFSHAVNLATPGGSAWASVPDSAYGSLPNSSHGSGSSEAESMMHATHYFDLPERRLEAPCAPTSNASRRASAGDGLSTSTAASAEQRDRLRQDAHSKVEKRYRMNINNKIQELRHLLSSNPSLAKQSFSNNPSIGGLRRRKSGAESSKRDILDQTINLLQNLQHEVQQLTSQNMELKEEIAVMRSYTADK